MLKNTFVKGSDALCERGLWKVVADGRVCSLGKVDLVEREERERGKWEAEER